MSDSTNAPQSREIIRHAANGFAMLLVNLGILFGGIACMALGAMRMSASASFSPLVVVGLLMEPLAVVLLAGHFTLQPNEARVLILFGSYHGTVRESGFFWANPFYARSFGQSSSVTKISLRARNFNSDKIKVNDKRGNPIEIAAVIGWRVADTARAAFDVNDYGSYVQIQSESAIRHIASLYSYDRADDDDVTDAEPTLRDSADEVAAALERELAARLEKSGVKVDEARLTHLAYAQEIAQAMLRRQQAEAVISARKKIVHGAVSMVEMALRELSEKAVVQMDEERKAAMVSNLLVVLCGESQVTPVVNTGTLYN
jgi:regulator of protease activity HflC (stomatin/prohibitin superfamily)